MKIALIILFVVGCGAAARHKTLVATFNATDAAAAQLISYSKQHEADIVKTATTKPVAEAELSDFRKKVDLAEKSLDGLYRALAAAAIADDDQTLTAMLQIAVIVSGELKELGMVTK